MGSEGPNVEVDDFVIQPVVAGQALDAVGRDEFSERVGSWGAED